MDELTKQLTVLAQQFGPQVYSAALGAVQINAWSDLVYSFADIVLGFLLGFGSFKLFKKARQLNNDDANGLEVGCAVVALGLAIVAFAVLIANLADLISPWTWVGLFHPELLLAKHALKL